MTKKTIGIGTILLLILLIVFGVGIGSARANTGLTHLRVHNQHALELNQLSTDTHSKSLLSGLLSLKTTVGFVKQQKLLTTATRQTFKSETLLATLRPNLTAQRNLHVLGLLDCNV